MSGKTRAGLASLGLVLLGFALGVLGDHLWLAHRSHEAQIEATHEESLAALLASLDLSAEQHDSIQQILNRAHATIEDRLAQVHPELLATIDSARQEIEVLLDSTQLVAFRDWVYTEHDRMRATPHSIIRH
jgi:oligoendopeptidase F